MAVTQFFTLDLPEAVKFTVHDNNEVELTMSRADAESLYSDLREALGYSGVGRADVPAQSVWEDLEGPSPDPGAVQMTPEQYLAMQQATAHTSQEPVYVRNPGSGIGNG